MVTLAGTIATEAIGRAATVSEPEPLTPSLIAVMLTVPEATARTRPKSDTVARSGFELAQATTRSVRTAP
jgi:hypothetical protein